MRVVVSEYNDGFNLIADNNIDKVWLKNFWRYKTQGKDNKVYAITLFAHQFHIESYKDNNEEKEMFGGVPMQININFLKGSSRCEK